MQEITCEELLQYLSDYIDNDLDEELTEVAQHHLGSCHNCRVVLDSTRKILFFTFSLGKRTIPAERRQRLFGHLQTAFLAKEDEV